MIGIDITEISRIAAAIEKQSFYEKVFTKNEREYYETNGKKAETLAGFFAAKEAVSKALGTGINGFSLLDIEVSHLSGGKPYVTLFNGAKDLLSGRSAEISISHSAGVAVAVCVLT